MLKLVKISMAIAFALIVSLSFFTSGVFAQRMNHSNTSTSAQTAVATGMQHVANEVLQDFKRQLAKHRHHSQRQRSHRGHNNNQNGGYNGDNGNGGYGGYNGDNGNGGYGGYNGDNGNGGDGGYNGDSGNGGDGSYGG